MFTSSTFIFTVSSWKLTKKYKSRKVKRKKKKKLSLNFYKSLICNAKKTRARFALKIDEIIWNHFSFNFINAFHANFFSCVQSSSLELLSTLITNDNNDDNNSDNLAVNVNNNLMLLLKCYLKMNCSVSFMMTNNNCNIKQEKQSFASQVSVILKL